MYACIDIRKVRPTFIMNDVNLYLVNKFPIYISYTKLSYTYIIDPLHHSLDEDMLTEHIKLTSSGKNTIVRFYSWYSANYTVITNGIIEMTAKKYI